MNLEGARRSPKRRVVGVIGGMGPAASAYFCLRVAQLTSAAKDQDHLHVVVDSDSSVPDRSAFLLGHGENPVPSMVAVARRLIGAGADLLVVPCNSATPLAQEVMKQVGAEFVAWADETVSHLVSVHPDARNVGLLATEGTCRTGVYHTRLAGMGVATSVPDVHVQQSVSNAIDAVKAGTMSATGPREDVLQAARRLVDDGAEVILIGCTELSLLFSADSGEWPAPVVDALDVVAAQTVLRAGGTLRSEGTIAA